MEDQCSPHRWGYYHQEEGMEELKHSLLYTTLELETTILSAQEEITKREYEVIHLKEVLNRTIKDRDEAQAKCQKLQLEKLLLQQQLQILQQSQKQQQQQEAAPLSGISLSEDESRDSDPKMSCPSSDSKENIIASPGTDPILQPPPLMPPLPQATLQLGPKKPLPEKGKFLQAVMDAGPLLQTLLLAGPLPQWQHPPPQLDSIEIPPVTVSPTMPRVLPQDSCTGNNGCFSKKRDMVTCEGYDCAPSKYQRIHH